MNWNIEWQKSSDRDDAIEPGPDYRQTWWETFVAQYFCFAVKDERNSPESTPPFSRERVLLTPLFLVTWLPGRGGFLRHGSIGQIPLFPRYSGGNMYRLLIHWEPVGWCDADAFVFGPRD